MSKFIRGTQLDQYSEENPNITSLNKTKRKKIKKLKDFDNWKNNIIKKN